jgi:hypothetical protein
MDTVLLGIIAAALVETSLWRHEEAIAYRWWQFHRWLRRKPRGRR